jgi:hypothetical protein
MLTFGRGGLPVAATSFDGTLRSLINCYQTDPDSRIASCASRCGRIPITAAHRLAEWHGDEDLGDIGGRTIIAWYKKWTG